MKQCTTLTKEVILKYKKENASSKQIAKEHNVTLPTVYKYARKFGFAFERPYNNLLGLRSGRLLVIEKTDKRRHHAIVWKCKCDCGNECLVRQDGITTGHTRSCGCLQRDRSNRQLPKGEASKNAFYTNYDHGARRRKISFEISQEDFILIAEMDCYYCGERPNRKYKSHATANGSFICNSIDRLDSNKGYTLDNCVSSCKMCNKMKMEFSETDFLNKIKEVYEHKKLGDK